MKQFRRSSRPIVAASLLLSVLIGWHGDAIGAQLNLTWVDGSGDEAGFALERSTGTTGAFAEITRTGPGVTAYTDSSVDATTVYCYRVRAFNAVMYSDYSNLACGTPEQIVGISVVKVGLGSGTVTSTPGGINCGTSCSGNYPSGTTVIATATPATGSTFTGWSGGGCTGKGTCAVIVTTTTTVTAAFAVQQVTSYMLSVTKSGLGSGTVTSNPAGITCGASCSANYSDGTAVTLTASPMAGSLFGGWSGGGCSGTGPCTVTAKAATTVAATFAPQVAPAFSVTPTGLTFTKTVGQPNPPAQKVTVTAAAGQVWATYEAISFANVTGSAYDGAGGVTGTGSGTFLVTPSSGMNVLTVGVHAGSIAVRRAGTADIMIPVQVVVVAAPSISLTVAKAGSGNGTVTSSPTTISCGVTCSAGYPSGTTVKLTAAPATGSTFTGWSGGGCSGTGTCTVIVKVATTVTATFALQPVTSTLKVAGLVAAYGFSESSGTSSADASGNGRTATLVGGPSRVAGKFGLALSFNGSSSYVTTSLTTNLPSWTISGWVQSPVAPNATGYGGPIHREANYQINWNHASSAFRGAAAVRVSGTWYAASFGVLAANTWYYLAATYDGQTLKAYTNGVLITANTAPSGPASADPNPLRIGRHAAINDFFEGTVDNVRIYNRALSGSEIQRDMNTPL